LTKLLETKNGNQHTKKQTKQKKISQSYNLNIYVNHKMIIFFLFSIKQLNHEPGVLYQLEVMHVMQLRLTIFLPINLCREKDRKLIEVKMSSFENLLKTIISVWVALRSFFIRE
jgi:hypothetical protein